MSYTGPERRRAAMSCQQEILDEIRGVRRDFSQLSKDFSQLDTDLQLMRQDSHTTHEEFRATLTKHDHTLYGNGKDGVLTDVDRLKTESKNQTWLVRSMLLVTLGLIGKSLWEGWMALTRQS